MPVDRIARHPTADIAMLFLQGEDARSEAGYPTLAFWDGVGNWSLGEEFLAYGYPSEGPTEGASNSPVARLFRGYFQRFMHFETPGGFQYLGGEMSIPAPGGLSGGPLFRPGAHTMVTGLVATNRDSYAVTDSIDEVDDAGKRFRLESRKVVSYGVAVMLSGVADWLNDTGPQRPDGRDYVLRQA